MDRAKTYLGASLGVVAIGLLWSAINPHDYPTWMMEVAPIFIVIPILLATFRTFPLTALLYTLFTLHSLVLMIGGHYTYAHVPLFDWIRDITGGERNSYDGVGHFVQGFVPAIAIRELLLRQSGMTSRVWLFIVTVFCCLGISALYELIEWGAAEAMGQGADEFLGTQGDVWDTQKDMALAGIGAIIGQLLLSKLHDRQLSQFMK